MRQPNYQLGWYVPDQIAALTHFRPMLLQRIFRELFNQARNSSSMLAPSFISSSTTA